MGFLQLKVRYKYLKNKHLQNPYNSYNFFPTF
nr:MAG TPA: hypothetical protein [Caudoviricetes sp.]DAW33313.1 MAG TPA: hypothetical protein [Caudoviricetes sp.]